MAEFMEVVEDLSSVIAKRAKEMNYSEWQILAYFISTYVEAIEDRGYSEEILEKVFEEMKEKFKRLRTQRVLKNHEK